MRNHDQKVKDMCESVLPSTSRKNAREKRRIAHGTARAHQRAALRAAIEENELGPALGDADGRRCAAIHEMVRDRRAADKVAPLIRWARATLEREPKLRNAAPEEVIAYFASLLPDNLIGRHAVQHIEWGLGLRRGDWRERAERRWAAQQAAAAGERTRYREAVITLVNAGRHGDINRVVRQLRRAQIAEAESDGKPVDDSALVPFLDGAHDIEAFILATQNRAKTRAAILQIV